MPLASAFVSQSAASSSLDSTIAAAAAIMSILPSAAPALSRTLASLSASTTSSCCSREAMTRPQSSRAAGFLPSAMASAKAAASSRSFVAGILSRAASNLAAIAFLSAFGCWNSACRTVSSPMRSFSCLRAASNSALALAGSWGWVSTSGTCEKQTLPTAINPTATAARMDPIAIESSPSERNPPESVGWILVR